MLKIISKPIGVGRERACYVHPEDPRLAIKIPTGTVTAQTERDIKAYKRLKNRGLVENHHLPKYHGLCETSIGRPLSWYLAQGVPVEEFDTFLEDLRQSFLQDLIIFNHDMHIGNLLFQKTSMGSARLVVIDGLGDTVALDWLDNIPFLVRRKINRRWKRFIRRLQRSQEVRAQRAAAQASGSR